MNNIANQQKALRLQQTFSLFGLFLLCVYVVSSVLIKTGTQTQVAIPAAIFIYFALAAIAISIFSAVGLLISVIGKNILFSSSRKLYCFLLFFSLIFQALAIIVFQHLRHLL